MSEQQQPVVISKEILDLFRTGSDEEKVKYTTSVIDMITNAIRDNGLNGFRSLREMLNNPQFSADFWFCIIQTFKPEYQERWFNFLMTSLNTKIL